MDANCHRHPAELIEATCRDCLHGYCTDCLVYVGGPDDLPYCINCALAVAGVRGSRRPKRSRREKRAAKKEAAALAAAQAALDEAPPIETPAEAPVEPVSGIEGLPEPTWELTPKWASDDRAWNLNPS